MHPPTHDDLLLPDPMHIAGPKKVEPEDVQTQWNPDKNITGGGKLYDSNSDLTHDVMIHIVAFNFTTIFLFMIFRTI